MKQIIARSTLFTILCLSTAFSQEEKGRLGLGVSLNPTALFSGSTTSTVFLPVGLTDIYLTLDNGKGFRLEPEFGIYSTSSESSTGAPYASSSSSSASLIRIGTGVFGMFLRDSSFNAYAGPRVGVLLTSQTSQSGTSPETTTSESDIYVGFSLGGEYYLSPHFSLGGEVQLNYIKFGEPKRDPASTTLSTSTRSMYTNNAVMFFRWYY